MVRIDDQFFLRRQVGDAQNLLGLLSGSGRIVDVQQQFGRADAQFRLLLRFQPRQFQRAEIEFDRLPFLLNRRLAGMVQRFGQTHESAVVVRMDLQIAAQVARGLPDFSFLLEDRRPLQERARRPVGLIRAPEVQADSHDGHDDHGYRQESDVATTTHHSPDRTAPPRGRMFFGFVTTHGSIFSGLLFYSSTDS